MSGANKEKDDTKVASAVNCEHEIKERSVEDKDSEAVLEAKKKRAAKEESKGKIRHNKNKNLKKYIF